MEVLIFTICIHGYFCSHSDFGLGVNLTLVYGSSVNMLQGETCRNAGSFSEHMWCQEDYKPQEDEMGGEELSCLS